MRASPFYLRSTVLRDDRVGAHHSSGESLRDMCLAALHPDSRQSNGAFARLTFALVVSDVFVRVLNATAHMAALTWNRYA